MPLLNGKSDSKFWFWFCMEKSIQIEKHFNQEQHMFRRNKDSERLPVTRRSNLSPFSTFSPDFWEPARWFDDVFSRDLFPSTQESQFLSPAIDIEESDTEYLVSADLPGVKKEDINVESSGNQLTISAERKYEKTEGRKRDRQERYFGAYQRTFTLPSGVKADEIRADFSNGELMVHIPKGEQNRAKKIEIADQKSSEQAKH